MKIGVLADTHIPIQASQLPAALFRIFEGVEHILHAGDIVELQVLDTLAALAPVTAVAGNMDISGHHLPLKVELQLGGKRIGLIHGYGHPRHQVGECVLREFTHADVVVYGHTHQPHCERKNGVLLLNPGSPTDSVFAPYLSVGLLHIDNQTVHGEIVPL